MTRIFVKAAILLSLAQSAQGFVSSKPILLTSYANQVQPTALFASPSNLSRRNSLLPIVAAITAFQPIIANAATDVVSNKVESPAALRTLKRISKALVDPSLDFMVSTNDYTGAKAALRQPPLTELRRSCATLLRGGASNEVSEKLQLSYQALIQAIEELDSNAGLGFRGRKGIELSPSYRKTVDSLTVFIELAEQSSALPIVFPTIEE